MKLKVGKEKEKMEKEEPVSKISDDQVLNLLFKQIEKPKNYFKIKVINVFGSNYRINFWSSFDEDGLTKTKIGYSYFVRVVDEVLTVKI